MRRRIGPLSLRSNTVPAWRGRIEREGDQDCVVIEKLLFVTKDMMTKEGLAVLNAEVAEATLSTEVWNSFRSEAGQSLMRAFKAISSSAHKATPGGSSTVTIPSPPAPSLVLPPATRLVSGLKWFLTPNAYSRIVAPLVAQEQHEYFEAIRQGDECLARWIGARMYLLITWGALWACLAPIAKVFRRAG